MDKFRKDVLYKLDRNEIKSNRNYWSHISSLVSIMIGTGFSIGNYILTGGDVDTSVSLGTVTGIGSKIGLEIANQSGVRREIRRLDKEYNGE